MCIMLCMCAKKQKHIRKHLRSFMSHCSASVRPSIHIYTHTHTYNIQITANEPQFTGHFPERPIMPGVLMVEAMAQLSGVLCLQAPVSDGKGLFFFAGKCVCKCVCVCMCVCRREEGGKS